MRIVRLIDVGKEEWVLEERRSSFGWDCAWKGLEWLWVGV